MRTADRNDEAPGDITIGEGADDNTATTAADDDGVDTSTGDSPIGKLLSRRGSSRHKSALAVGIAMIAGLGILTALLGFRAYHAYQADGQRALFLQVGRQGALNLTTIDWRDADTDVQRILDGATGQFRDDFAQRAGPFTDVVKQAKSTSEGTVAQAGMESMTDDGAQILVAINVKTMIDGAPQQHPRAWRMRISVQRAGEDTKVSNVEFVP